MDKYSSLPMSRRGLARTLLAMGGGVAFARTAGAQGGPVPEGAGGPPSGPRVNATVFQSGHIASVSALTKVFGRSQRTIAAIVEYDAPIAH